MTRSATAATAYAAASQIASPCRMVVMLYDGMIKAVVLARQAILDGRIEERFNQTQKASRIVLGLQGHLDFERGGAVSPMLDRFYDTIFARLQEINVRNSTAICDDVVKALGAVRESWEEVARQTAAGVAPSANPGEAAARAMAVSA
jgi:flagellar protein FliS